MRNQQLVTLTDDRLMRIAPSIFAEQPYEEVSDKYTFIPTSRLVEELRRNNWNPVRASQSSTRIAGKESFTKHMVRFRYGDNMDHQEVGDVVPELVLFNSHDAGSSFQLSAGLFRKVCSNGMVVADSTFAKVRVPHRGDIVREVIEGSFKVLHNVPEVLEEVDNWQQIETDPHSRLALARATMRLRWKQDEEPIEAHQLLKPRRYGDKATDLWTQFNVIQENMMKGGVRGYKRNDRGQVHRTTTRQIKAPAQEIGLNAAMWELTKNFAEMVK